MDDEQDTQQTDEQKVIEYQAWADAEARYQAWLDYEANQRYAESCWSREGSGYGWYSGDRVGR